MQGMRQIFLDTETTGLSPESGDRIIEIGCVEMLNRRLSGRNLHFYVNPERRNHEEAVKVHGLTDEFLADKPLFASIADELIEFVDGAEIIIHNAGFDTKFLNAELSYLGKSPLSPERVIDTLMMARQKHPGANNSLDGLCRRYGVDNSRRTRHGALLDSELLAEVYIELIGGRQTALSLTAVQAKARIVTSGSATLTARPRPLASRLTEEEMAAHDRLVEELGSDALWKIQN